MAPGPPKIHDIVNYPYSFPVVINSIEFSLGHVPTETLYIFSAQRVVTFYHPRESHRRIWPTYGK